MSLEARCGACGHTFLLDDGQLSEGAVQLPCPACGAPIDVRSPRPAVAANAATEDVVCPRCGLHFQPRPEVAAAARRERKTVLVVEDMDYFREIARDALSSKFDVRAVGSIDEAWRVLQGGGVDLLVLDLTLEGSESGESLLARLRHKPCPVLVFTAKDESEMYGEEWDRLRALGADDMVIKGMHVEESLMRKACELLNLPWGEDDLEGPDGL